MTYYAIAVPLFTYDFYVETPAPVFPCVPQCPLWLRF